MQLLAGVALAGVALALPTPYFLPATLALFWLLAFASATHDVAADGFYLLALAERDQAWFNGIRSTCYRLAAILAKGQLVILAGVLAASQNNFSAAWSEVFGLVAGLVLLLGIYHRFILPHRRATCPEQRDKISPVNFSRPSRRFLKSPASAARSCSCWSTVSVRRN